MKWYRKWYRQFKDWVISENFDVIRVDDFPEILEEKNIYIVGEKNPWLIVFTCPCGCTEIIQLNLLDDEYPSWQFTYRKEIIDVYPSVRRINGCGSHFWIQKGKVRWCRY